MRIRKNKRISPLLILGVALLYPMIFGSFRDLTIQANNDPLSGWDKTVLKQANTAVSATYLSDDEKKLIFYSNLCRLKPKLFCQTVLEDYLKTHEYPVEQVTSLKSQLNADQAEEVMVPDKELCNIAHNFAKKMGEEGKEGHPDFQNRIKPVMSRYNKVGENCDYGNKLPLDAFMHLLIDSSDPVRLMHRKNIVDPSFKAIGVALQPHKIYQWNYVMDFGGQ